MKIPITDGRNKQIFKTLGRFFILLFLVSFHSQTFAQLDDSWTLSAGGRTVRANADGSFTLSNISAPDRFGPGGPGTLPDFLSDDYIRVIGTKTISGITHFVFSQPFRIRQGQTIDVGPLTFSTLPPPLPKSIRVDAPLSIFSAIDETIQLTVTATLVDNSQQDVTPATTWTSYRSSNPDIALVDLDGLVTAKGAGTVFITSVNAGATAVKRFESVPGDPLTTVEGFVHFQDNSPAAGVEVRIPEIVTTTTTDASGFFSFPDIPTTLLLSVTSVTMDFSTNQTLFGGISELSLMPGLISDIGIISLIPLINQDTDGDGLFDDLEILVGLDPANPDTDGDGILDGNEDADSDTLADAWEILLGTDPNLGDSDGDGTTDDDEDQDSDGLTNAEEINDLDTNPFLLDTDGDSWTDFAEFTLGSDPLDPNSQPAGEERQFVTSSSTAFINLGNQALRETQDFVISTPSAFVNIGDQPISETQNFSINTPVSFDNSP